MRKFKFFALAFAALSFAACSDDAIDGQGGNTGTTGDGTPAYLTISFVTNGESSTRSTADDANNQGDTDGSPEDSGHENSGTPDEKAVDKVLVVITPANGGNVNFAKLYNTNTATTANDDGTFDVTNTATGAQFTNDEPIELTTGQYNVVVVANPVDALIRGIAEADLNAGIANSNVAENLYSAITTGIFAPSSETDYKNIATGVKQNTDDENFRIMMASKALSSTPGQEYSVELDEDDTVEDPASVTVNIERAYSKITFRETKYNNEDGKENIYEVPVRVGQVEARLVEAAIKNSDITGTEEGPATYVYRKLNAALDSEGHDVYVLWEAAAEGATPVFKGVYYPTEETQSVDVSDTGTPQNENKTVYAKLEAITDAAQYEEGTNYVIETLGQPTSGLTYLSDETGVVDHWYVRLEGYALVNLSKNVYYVRHTTDNLGQSPFGTLDGSNYLYTPYWSEKNNDANFTTNTDGNIVFVQENGSPISEKWFYNTLAQVSAESDVMTINASGDFKITGDADALYFKDMPTGDDSGNVTGDGSNGQHTQAGNTLPSVGKFMSYCFENSTDINHQMHGLSTGISFVARIYADADCDDKISTLYRYDGHLFESLEAIQKSYGANLMSKKFNELVEKEVITDGITNITKADMKALAEYEASDESTSTVGDAGKNGEVIDFYADGICYYYTTEIKHFDNDSNTSLGNMEFAIMRNNIYSLAVTGINEIGDPYVDPTPDIPNENTDPTTALNVEVQIVPWIVRYNDIEF